MEFIPTTRPILCDRSVQVYKLTFCVRRKKPQEENDLNLVVKRHPPRDKDVGDSFGAEEKREDDPIHHPFDIVTNAFGFHR